MINKLSISKIFEAAKSIAGTWIQDELVVRTYPMADILSRIVEVGYDFSKNKKMEGKLKKLLPDIIKSDKSYAIATIDTLNDTELDDNEISDQIDRNVDEFISNHKEKLSIFAEFKRQ